ncbi:hypothetical protein XENTR_v10013896 [Xenopus tropicalis]|nr:hypothetical protein XENTR_v10013896 [Xenopus tropicalis]
MFGREYREVGTSGIFCYLPFAVFTFLFSFLPLTLWASSATLLWASGQPILPFPSQVVYNRVGKCGSRTIVLLLRILSEKHGFNLVTSDIHNKTRLTRNEQMELIKNISTADQPYLFTRHVHFLNFSSLLSCRFGAEQPVYINIVRDPVSRFLSNYFFRRFGDWRGEQNHMIRTPGMKEEERNLDINECILENYAECSNPRLFYIIPYFCGQHPKCRSYIKMLEVCSAPYEGEESSSVWTLVNGHWNELNRM